jgi:hypothetical protein
VVGSLQDQLALKESEVTTLRAQLAHLRAWMQQLQQRARANDPHALLVARELYVGGVPDGTSEVRRAVLLYLSVQQNSPTRCMLHQRCRRPATPDGAQVLLFLVLWVRVCCHAALPEAPPVVTEAGQKPLQPQPGFGRRAVACMYEPKGLENM